jgi:hypothetical protein
MAIVLVGSSNPLFASARASTPLESETVQLHKQMGCVKALLWYNHPQCRSEQQASTKLR